MSGAGQGAALDAAYYADQASFTAAPILENRRLARSTYLLRVDAPGVAQRILPGQFVMLRLAGLVDPMLGRAFALYDVARDASGAPAALDVVYLVHGKLTSALATRAPGERVELWGPLGNGFKPPAAERLVMVAGGIGYTPFLALGKEALGRAEYGAPPREARGRVRDVVMCYGVRTADLLAGEDDFRAAGVDLRVASDDGTVGHHGLVTDVLRDALNESPAESTKVVCCGPEPMMAATAEVCRAAGVRCDVSLETPMACGIGVCFSCVAKVRQPDGDWDYKRTCVDGPVFNAADIVW